MDTFSGVKSNTGLCIGCKFSYCWKRDKGIHVDECPEYTPKDKEPSDMVEVIRCKDCKYWLKSAIMGTYPDDVRCMCEKMSFGIKVKYTRPDDYCSFAEKVAEK